MAEKPNYKETIFLPKTDFPMKGNLPQNEPKTIERWENSNIYKKMVDQREGKPLFVMPDGPPYANGNLHLGHVLNKVLKDIVIKYKNLAGYQAAFIPGWDCHGLPIELNVTKKLGSKRKDKTDADIRKLCREEALKWVDTQRDQFRRLGVLADWDNPYLTLQPEYEAEEVRVLGQILKKGVLYRGEKPVYWCPALQTALAAAEVEYHDHKSPSIFVKFYAKKGLEKIGSPEGKVGFVIWTTTPWTLPANYAISVHPDFEYGLYECGDEKLIFATELSESIQETTGLELKKLSTFKGAELEGMKAQHPFMDRESLIILGDHVSLDAGTGLVHTAPGHGLDDYNMGIKYGLPVHSPVDEAGKFTDDVPQYKGLKIWDANKSIPEDLKNSGHLLHLSEIEHSYPHNPRSKTPLIFRSTPQWFVRMDDESFPVRKNALAAAEDQIEFIPGWGSQRLKAMITNTPDWCLSRQRIWGVPIPVFYCEKCGKEHLSEEVINKVADIMESSGKGIDAYHDEPNKIFLGDHKCEECGHGEFKKGQDILDVWFDSGVCHAAVQRKREKMKFPADIYLEGSDQHRGWFQTSLISSIASNGTPPYKALVTHGFVNDKDGRKMSKSLGNVIDPAKVIQKSGAEILRLWVAYEDYGQDVNVGDEMFKRITETYRRFRNTYRFLLGALADFDSKEHIVEFKDMEKLDQWAMIQLNELTQKVVQSYDDYDYYKVYHALNHFFTVTLSATYLDIIKDRLYTWKRDGNPRRSTQSVIFHLLNSLTVMKAPILTFLADEVYKYVPNHKHESILLEDFPQPQSDWSDDQLRDDFELILEIRSEISKQAEELRREKVIGSSLDTMVNIVVPEKDFKILQKYESHLFEYFIVSRVSLKSGDARQIQVQKANGEKCSRCWHYDPNTGKVDGYPEICPKCVEALK